jgi:hypothetical protein
MICSCFSCAPTKLLIKHKLLIFGPQGCSRDEKDSKSEAVDPPPAQGPSWGPAVGVVVLGHGWGCGCGRGSGVLAAAAVAVAVAACHVCKVNVGHPTKLFS